MLNTISSFQISRLNNAEATAFFINVQKAIVEMEADQLGLESSLVTNYNNTLKKLVDQVYVALGSQHTATMNAADTKRTQIMKRIRLRLQMVECCDDNPALLACKDVVTVELLGKYRADVARMAAQAKTAVIQGFLWDLTNRLTEDDMEALGIESDISALTAANNAFVTAYNSRSAERAAGDTQVTVKLRQQLGDLWQQITFTVQYFANCLDAEKAATTTACQQFIALVNVILADAKKRYLQRTGKLTETNGEGDDQPSDDAPGNNQGAGGSGNNTDSGSGNNVNGTDVPDDVVFPGM